MYHYFLNNKTLNYRIYCNKRPILNVIADNQASSSNNFGNAKHDMVYKMVSACQRDEGINRDELLTQLKAKMSRQDIDSSLDFLSGEGHIYSTIDDDHFKAIDG